MKNQFFASVAFAALLMPAAAFAQSTGSIESEEEIVVTASRSEDGVAGIVVPEAVKARAVLTQELISTQAAGQSILNTINIIPGVNFTNSDAYGSSGGNIRIRGFDGNRISLTFDGFPLNDSGNYAIFSNQQLDPEIIYSVNVNLGTTDVDSPTASAAGGTVNYLTRTPSDEPELLASGSIGTDNFRRAFAMLDTGDFTGADTRAFIAGSIAKNDKFKGPGEIYKRQVNTRWQHNFGDNGDFIALTAHYNQNRNNFYRNPTLGDLRTLTGNATQNNFLSFTKSQIDALRTFDNFDTCARDAPTANTADNENAGSQNNPANTAACTNYFNLRINPSNTGNVHWNSKFSLADNLKLTFDAGWFYVLANGGGTATISETDTRLRGNTALAGFDVNGDGDTRDTIRFYTPNTTNTRRLIALTSLIYEISEQHRVRIAYSYDRAKHRQTGEWGYLDALGNPENVFGGRNGRPLVAADGSIIRGRDRQSIALLNQIAGEYRGKFLDEALTFSVGLRMPFFERDLDQRCYVQRSNGNQTCTTQPIAQLSIISAANPNGTFYAPFTAKYKFSPVLPNVGALYKITDELSLFGSYAKGFSAPRTDNLYRAPRVEVDPETTDSFDLGLKFARGNVQAQATAWYTTFKNRIVTSFDQAAGISVDRNVGSVKAKGFDASIAFKPLSWFTFNPFMSYNDSKLQDDIVTGIANGQPIVLATSGKRVAETPKFQWGYFAQAKSGFFTGGLTVKHVGKRFATDLNDISSGSYTTVDANLRVSLEGLGAKRTHFQLNAINLFNRFYLGNISTQIAGPSFAGGANPNWSVGAPRTVLGTIQVGF